MQSSKLTLIIGRCWGAFLYRMNALASAYATERLRCKLRTTGPNVELPSNLEVDYAERISIGDWVYIGPGGSLSGRGGLEIADHVVIGPKVIIMTSMHNYRGAKYIPYDEIELLKPVKVGLACWIGMGAIVMPGVTLGKGCIVGAGSVVTKSFPDGSIVAGNPAKIVGQRDMQLFLDHLAKDRTYLKNWYFKGKPKVEQMADV
jgi:acetyltransferase-like isoleucine patch superfamily enzyme